MTVSSASDTILHQLMFTLSGGTLIKDLIPFTSTDSFYLVSKKKYFRNNTHLKNIARLSFKIVIYANKFDLKLLI